jgi:hypothetical protein
MVLTGRRPIQPPMMRRTLGGLTMRTEAKATNGWWNCKPSGVQVPFNPQVSYLWLVCVLWPSNMAALCGSYHGISPLPTDVALFGSHVPSSTYNATTNTYTDTNGCNYRQLFQEVPALRPLYSEFEANFTALSFVEFANRYFHVAFLICAAYALFLIVGGRVMKNRAPFKLRSPLLLWNICLATFSLIGFLRTAPHLLYFLFDRGFYSSVRDPMCNTLPFHASSRLGFVFLCLWRPRMVPYPRVKLCPYQLHRVLSHSSQHVQVCAPSEPSYGHGAVGLWTMLFIYSKIPELGDTVFVILRKNNLIFLHWYHHVRPYAAPSCHHLLVLFFSTFFCRLLCCCIAGIRT